MSRAVRVLVQLAACVAALALAVQSYANGAACDWPAAAAYGATSLALLAAVEPMLASR